MPTKKVSKKVAVKKVAKKVAKKPTKTAVKKTTKPVVKKSPTKVAKKSAKPVAKKVSKKSVSKSKKNLVFASDQTAFWVTNGQILNSLVALRDALDEMEKEVYQYHAGKNQNDFANWVDVVLCDGTCATALEKAKTPNSAKTVVVRHLKAYSV